MKIIHYKDIVENIAKLCKQACCVVTPDLKQAFKKAKEDEKSPLGKSIICKMLYEMRKREKIVRCLEV